MEKLAKLDLLILGEWRLADLDKQGCPDRGRQAVVRREVSRQVPRSSTPMVLKIVLAVLSGVVLGLVALLLGLRFFLRRIVKGFAAALAQHVPVRIQVLPKKPEDRWVNEALVIQARRELEEQAGFRWVSDFAVKPMNGCWPAC